MVTPTPAIACAQSRGSTATPTPPRRTAPSEQLVPCRPTASPRGPDRGGLPRGSAADDRPVEAQPHDRSPAREALQVGDPRVRRPQERCPSTGAGGVRREQTATRRSGRMPSVPAQRSAAHTARATLLASAPCPGRRSARGEAHARRWRDVDVDDPSADSPAVQRDPHLLHDGRERHKARRHDVVERLVDRSVRQHPDDGLAGATSQGRCACRPGAAGRTDRQDVRLRRAGAPRVARGRRRQVRVPLHGRRVSGWIVDIDVCHLRA